MIADVSAIDRGRVDGRRIADAAKVKDVLLVALEEDTGTAAKRRSAVSEDIIGKTKAWSEVVPAEVLSALRQSVGAFADHAVIRVSGTGE